MCPSGSLEPGDAQVAADVDVALALQSRQLVVREGHAFGAQGGDDGVERAQPAVSNSVAKPP